jgi:hypothetical protein
MQQHPAPRRRQQQPVHPLQEQQNNKIMPLNSKSILRFSLAFAVLLLVFFVSCKKKSNTPTPVAGPGMLSGTLYIKSFYANSNDSFPLTNKTVYIRYDSSVSKDTSNHFFSMQTDNNGNFSFYLPNTLLRYDIFTYVADTSSKSFSPYYSAYLITELPFDPNKNYVMTATIDTVNRNGLNLVSEDTNRQVIPGAQVIIYTSRIIAASDSTAFSGMGSFYKFTTDSLGKGFVSQLPPGIVYINSVLSLGVNTKLSLFDSTLVPLTGIKTDTLILK